MRTVAALVLAVAALARAEVPGGGLPDADCRVVFEGVSATAGGSGVVCRDGDPACDADGVVDGKCTFTVEECIGTATGSCEPVPLTGITVAGLALVPPAVPAAGGTGGPARPGVVAVGGGAAATVLARGGGSLRDVDYLNLCCVATPSPFDAVRCALDVDLTASGCTTREIPHRVRTAFAHARALVGRLERDPARTALRRQAEHRLAVVQNATRRLAGRNPCGDALGLIATHARDVLQAAGTAPSAR